MPRAPHTLEKISCYHCGEDCDSDDIKIEEKTFCCQGCKTVYQVLDKNSLCEYYDITQSPGLNQRTKIREGKFAFLDDATVVSAMVYFSEGTQNHVQFYLPQMHCSSCVWLLEQLSKLDEGILRSQVDFLRKELRVVFDKEKTSLRKVAELLTLVGYESHISLHELSTKKIRKYDKGKIYRIGVAGFCFGNIMMLSFPEYFSLGNIEEKGLKELFSYLNLFLALPVFFYCSSEFFISSWKAIKQRFLNIDAPIALAIVITFARSVYEIMGGRGAGYLDSMSGIVFFMLLGRFFQDKTYQTISFERDYTSYFPLGITRIDENAGEVQVPVSKLKAGDRIKIHSEEIVPADSILFLGKAQIDYSFVTGESLPVERGIGEIIYAGGKQVGGVLELEVVKDVSQSYLTQLWNNDAFKERERQRKPSFIHGLSRYFTLALFSVAIVSAIWWQMYDPSKTWPAVTAVLIVACPCALLLSATFTNGNMLRKLQKAGFYAKNAAVMERISEADVVVFDKTGTITKQNDPGIIFSGELTVQEKKWVRSLAAQSTHPLSKAVKTYLAEMSCLPVKEFEEFRGKGISGNVEGHAIELGSASFLGVDADKINGSIVYVSVDDELKGYFLVKNTYRSGLGSILSGLKERFELILLSGDNESEREALTEIFGRKEALYFNCSPQQKLDHIKALQQKGKTVIMLGDGLNDAGALRQSDVGIVITDDTNNFSPACDAILEGKSFSKLQRLFDYCRKEKVIIGGSFVISILYNIVGLFYAAQGELQPVIAAILMPVSSASIMLFTTGMSSWYAIKLKNKTYGNNDQGRQP